MFPTLSQLLLSSHQLSFHLFEDVVVLDSAVMVVDTCRLDALEYSIVVVDVFEDSDLVVDVLEYSVVFVDVFEDVVLVVDVIGDVVQLTDVLADSCRGSCCDPRLLSWWLMCLMT